MAVVVLQGPVVEAVLETAAEVGADWIVLGSHGHGALYDLLVGSTVEGVMSVAKVPIVVIPDHRALRTGQKKERLTGV